MNVAIVVPVYKPVPAEEELYSLQQIQQKYPNTDKFLVIPEGLNMVNYPEEHFSVYCFPKRYFKSERTYTRLLLNKNFYHRFKAYDYMLLIQTDVWLVKGEKTIYPFLEQGYDYVGAPWFEGNKIYPYTFHGIGKLPDSISHPQICYVGNGGFSLRKIKSFIKLLEKYKLQAKLWRRAGEDTFFSYYGMLTEDFRIPDIQEAAKFSLEKGAREQWEKGVKPIGIHAWKKYYPEIMRDDKE